MNHALGFVVVQDNDEFIEKEQVVKVEHKEEDDESIGEEEDYFALGRLPPTF
jgi:hypothetical protein